MPSCYSRCSSSSSSASGRTRSPRAIAAGLSLSLACLLASSAALAADPRTLNVHLSEDVNGPADPIVVYFDKRLTFVMPSDVRLAVPGSPDVLAAHIRDHVVVLTLVDSPYVRERKPTTNLSIFTHQGAPFTARIEVGEAPEEARYDLVRVIAPAGRRLRASQQALEVMKAWLKEGDAALAPETAERFADALTPLLEARAHRTLLRRVARDGVDVLAEAGARVKSDFIYLELGGLYRVGEEAILRFSLTNHSQRTFNLDRATLETEGGSVPARLESLDPNTLNDGQPRQAVVAFDARHLLGAGALQVKLCEAAAQPRCVQAVIR